MVYQEKSVKALKGENIQNRFFAVFTVLWIFFIVHSEKKCDHEDKNSTTNET